MIETRISNLFDALSSEPYNQVMQCKNDIHHHFILLFEKYNTRFGI